jgi:hypothetical protein
MSSVITRSNPTMMTTPIPRADLNARQPNRAPLRRNCARGCIEFGWIRHFKGFLQKSRLRAHVETRQPIHDGSAGRFG